MPGANLTRDEEEGQAALARRQLETAEQIVAALGTMKGAFIRGRFDVSAALKPGRNAVAVRVSPPPHPGLAHEESLTAGVGENGGMEMLDGPTFAAAEGWDWIPTLRDRNTGL